MLLLTVFSNRQHERHKHGRKQAPVGNVNGAHERGHEDERRVAQRKRENSISSKTIPHNTPPN